MEENQMKERKEMILSLMNEPSYVPMKIKELAILLEVPKERREELKEVLDALLEEGRIRVSKKGKYAKPEVLAQKGVFTAHPRGFGFVSIEGREGDVFVAPDHKKDAMDGDTVQVLVTESGRDGRPEAEVLKVLKRANETVIGLFEKNRRSGFVIPDNPRILSDIYIPQGKEKGAVSGHKVVVRLDSYGGKEKSPEGHVMEILGHINDPGVDILSIVRAYGLSETYPKEVMDEAEKILLEDLLELKHSGVRLNLLLNANCYGGSCISVGLAKQVLERAAFFLERGLLDAVTTASFFIADVLKRHFPDLPLRSSVNMKLGTLDALEYAGELFDSFCLQRDLNYFPDQLQLLADRAAGNGKSVCLLANSGCLRNCAAQIFHDNLVAHMGEMDFKTCSRNADPVFCRRFFRNRNRKLDYLAYSTLIRPEDLVHYEKITSRIKLATRTHCKPRLVMEAYCSGHFRGNLFDLTEPGHGILFRGQVLDNTRIPAEYWTFRSACSRDCRTCGYCRKVMEESLVSCEEIV